MRHYRVSSPRDSLCRSAVHLDNVALVPASALPFKTEWQAIAKELPNENVLIVLPAHAKQRRIARFVASHLTGKGKRVVTVDYQPQLTLIQPRSTSPSL